MTEDEAIADFLGRRAIAGYLTVPVYAKFHEWLGRGELLRPMWEAWAAGDRKTATAVIPRETIDDLLIYGDAATCRAEIEAYVDAGVTVPVLNFLPASADPKERARQSIEWLRALAPGAG